LVFVRDNTTPVEINKTTEQDDMYSIIEKWDHRVGKISMYKITILTSLLLCWSLYICSYRKVVKNAGSLLINYNIIVLFKDVKMVNSADQSTIVLLEDVIVLYVRQDHIDRNVISRCKKPVMILLICTFTV
jgi:hypothetical protein